MADSTNHTETHNNVQRTTSFWRTKVSNLWLLLFVIINQSLLESLQNTARWHCAGRNFSNLLEVFSLQNIYIDINISCARIWENCCTLLMILFIKTGWLRTFVFMLCMRLL